MNVNNWFTVKVKYTKQQENGAFKRVTESYLFYAVSFTDAEARVYEELASYNRGEFIVLSITRTELQDIFVYEESEVWYKAVVSYDKMDDEGDKKKVIKQNFLVSAETVKEATERLIESLRGLMIDYSIKGVTETPILDIFPFKEEEEN